VNLSCSVIHCSKSPQPFLVLNLKYYHIACYCPENFIKEMKSKILILDKIQISFKICVVICNTIVKIFRLPENGLTNRIAKIMMTTVSMFNFRKESELAIPSMESYFQREGSLQNIYAQRGNIHLVPLLVLKSLSRVLWIQMKIGGRNYLADSSKRSNINQIAAGSRLPRSSQGFSSFFYFSNTLCGLYETYWYTGSAFTSQFHHNKRSLMLMNAYHK